MGVLIISVIQRAIVAGIPLLLGTVGEIITERSGILNLGVEGMMSVGAVTAFITAMTTGNPYLGILAAVLASSVLALIHAFSSISLRANQTVSGLAITMVGLGISGLWGKPFIGKPLLSKVTPFRLPLLSDIPVVGAIFSSLDVFFYIAVILTIAAWFFLEKTKAGIVVRTCGENPKAAESHGTNVDAVRYVCTVIGGAFVALAGAHLTLSYSSSWIEGMTGGRGWIVVALTIFAFWNPLRAFFGAFLFGGIFVLQYLLQPIGIPSNVLAMLPYVTTLVVLVIDGLRKDHRRLHAPAALGELFRRGER